MKGFKPNHKMSHGGDMGGDGRKHSRIETAKYAKGGTVTYSKKEPKFGGNSGAKLTNKPPKFGGGRPAGKVTNKPPKFGGNRPAGEVTIKDYAAQRKIDGGGISGGPTKLPKGQTAPGSKTKTKPSTKTKSKISKAPIIKMVAYSKKEDKGDKTNWMPKDDNVAYEKKDKGDVAVESKDKGDKTNWMPKEKDAKRAEENKKREERIAEREKRRKERKGKKTVMDDAKDDTKTTSTTSTTNNVSASPTTTSAKSTAGTSTAPSISYAYNPVTSAERLGAAVVGKQLKKGGKVMKKADGGAIAGRTAAAGKPFMPRRGRPFGEVTNKLPRAGGLEPMPKAPDQLYLGGSKNFNESRPGLVKRAPIGGGVFSPIGRPAVGVTNKPPKFGSSRPGIGVATQSQMQSEAMAGRNPPALGQLSLDSPMRRNPPALGKLPLKKIAGFKGGIDPSGRGVYDALKNPQARLKKGGSAKKGMK
jgi:hypothetical protein